jgi:NAD(P)-dependent dehydrogenase (short-subunit alcohol dehydrogenase family)
VRKISLSTLRCDVLTAIDHTGGIGLATAKAFLDANAKGLLLVDLNDEALKKALKGFTPEEQARCEVFVADVSSMEQASYAQRAYARWGRLDIAVLNAGICLPRASIFDTEVDTWDKIMAVNGRGGKLQISILLRLKASMNESNDIILHFQCSLD